MNETIAKLEKHNAELLSERDCKEASIADLEGRLANLRDRMRAMALQHKRG